jgi:cytochrome bd-type quinol oxidase subunit 1
MQAFDSSGRQPIIIQQFATPQKKKKSGSSSGSMSIFDVISILLLLGLIVMLALYEYHDESKKWIQENILRIESEDT